MVLSSRRSEVHNPGAGLVIAGHCRLFAIGWLGLQSIQQVQQQQRKKQKEHLSGDISIIRIYTLKNKYVCCKQRNMQQLQMIPEYQ